VNKRKLNSLARHSLQVAVKQCVALPGIPVLRWLGPIPSHSLFADYKDEEGCDLHDEIVEKYPWALPSRKLIGLAWHGILSSSWSLEAVRLDHKIWLYFEFNDTMDDYLNLLAVAKTASPQKTHQHFLTERFRSNDFLICPPTAIVSRFARSFLAKCFTVAINKAINEGLAESTDFWEEVRDNIAQRKPDSSRLSEADEREESGKALLLEAYLAAVVTS
jgi:hypothetical protein